MRLRSFVLSLALFATAAAPGRAWVISDKVTDVELSADGDLILTRKIRRNIESKQEVVVWEFVSKASAGRPLMGVSFQDGAFADQWVLKTLDTHPRQGALTAILRKVTADPDKKMKEPDFRALVAKSLKPAPVKPTADCGATLREDKLGYTLAVRGADQKLNWKHENKQGKPFRRAVDRCYEAKGEVLGVVLTMAGTVTEAALPGEKPVAFADFSTETLVWTLPTARAAAKPVTAGSPLR